MALTPNTSFKLTLSASHPHSGPLKDIMVEKTYSDYAAASDNTMYDTESRGSRFAMR